MAYDDSSTKQEVIVQSAMMNLPESKHGFRHPLVDVHTTKENHHVSWVNQL